MPAVANDVSDLSQIGLAFGFDLTDMRVDANRLFNEPEHRVVVDLFCWLQVLELSGSRFHWGAQGLIFCKEAVIRGVPSSNKFASRRRKRLHYRRRQGATALSYFVLEQSFSRRQHVAGGRSLPPEPAPEQAGER